MSVYLRKRIMSKSRWFVEKIVSHIYINGIENIRSQNVDQAIYDAIFRRCARPGPRFRSHKRRNIHLGFALTVRVV